MEKTRIRDPGWKKTDVYPGSAIQLFFLSMQSSAKVFRLCTGLYADPDSEFYSMQVLIRHYS
jgi:hypothetical protein